MTTWDGRQAYWTGDEWRWGLTASTYRSSIYVIEPPREEPVATESPSEPTKKRFKKRRKAQQQGVVPFGFSRALGTNDARSNK